MNERETKTILVIGARTMGHGIALVAARAGYRALLHDIDSGRIQSGLSSIRESLGKALARGKITNADHQATLARVEAAPDLHDAARDAEIAIEAVPEDLELKRQTFRTLDAACGENVILASNTSSLSITAIAEVTHRPASVIGMHFFNPVPLMPLVEIVRGRETSQAVVDTVREAATRMGKETIVVRDSPGFATSRLGIAIGLEAMRMFEEGVASAEDIDRAMELGYSHPMGPLRLTDLVGLDVRLAIAEHLSRELGTDRFRPPEILRAKVAEGKLGKKSGEGFYKWEGKG